MATNTYPVLIDPAPYRQTEVTIGPAALLVDQFDVAIFQVSQAMVGAMVIYRERQRGR
jgi:hypothetical protein